jgi:hypothetical protein
MDGETEMRESRSMTDGVEAFSSLVVLTYGTIGLCLLDHYFQYLSLNYLFSIHKVMRLSAPCTHLW